MAILTVLVNLHHLLKLIVLRYTESFTWMHNFIELYQKGVIAWVHKRVKVNQNQNMDGNHRVSLLSSFFLLFFAIAPFCFWIDVGPWSNQTIAHHELMFFFFYVGGLTVRDHRDKINLEIQSCECSPTIPLKFNVILQTTRNVATVLTRIWIVTYGHFHSNGTPKRYICCFRHIHSTLPSKWNTMALSDSWIIFFS